MWTVWTPAPPKAINMPLALEPHGRHSLIAPARTLESSESQSQASHTVLDSFRLRYKGANSEDPETISLSKIKGLDSQTSVGTVTNDSPRATDTTVRKAPERWS